MRLFSGVCTSKARLEGKTAIITGCNTGIGKPTAKDFFIRGAKVIMACRNVEKAEQAAADIRRECENEKNTGKLLVTQLDLSNLKSVRECSKKLLETEDRIDLLVNNAGIMACPESKTEDGFEMQFGTNHLGHFLFTLLLLPKMVKSVPARIVNVSSKAHDGQIHFEDLNYENRPYKALEAYKQSKLANILFTKELARRIEAANIKNLTTYTLHPGVIRTDLGRHFDETYFRGISLIFYSFRWLMKSLEQGAQTTIYCAVDEKAANETGLYYADCEPEKPSKEARNPETAKKLWEVSLNLVGLDENYNPFKQ